VVHQTRCYDLTNDPTYDLTNDPWPPFRRSPRAGGYPRRMGRALLPTTIEEFQARVDAATGGHATPDDHWVTRDGRVLDTKDKVLAFLAELDTTRRAEYSVRSP